MIFVKARTSFRLASALPYQKKLTMRYSVDTNNPQCTNDQKEVDRMTTISSSHVIYALIQSGARPRPTLRPISESTSEPMNTDKTVDGNAAQCRESTKRSDIQD